MRKIKFWINSPSELAAGLHGFTDVISVVVHSGDPGGEGGEFEEHIRQALVEWYDGATVECFRSIRVEVKDEKLP